MRYLQFAFSYKGVLSRTEFLFVLLSNYIISIIVSVVVFAALGSVMVNPHELEGVVPVAVMLIMLAAMSSPAVRRMKDMGAKGWWLLGLVVPYLNFGVLLALLFKPAWNQEKGLRHLFVMMKALAESDGHVNRDEADFFAGFCAELIPNQKFFSLAVDNFIQGTSNPLFGFDHHLKKYLKDGQPSLGDRAFVMGLMTELAQTDGELSPEEFLLLEKVHSAFGLSKELPEGFDNLIAMLAKLAKADGVVGQSEINVIQNWFTNALDFSKEQLEKAFQIFREAKNSDISFEQYARNFLEFHKENIELFENVMDLFMELVLADGDANQKELDLIDSAAQIFGFPEKEGGFYEYWKEKASAFGKGDEQIYANVLGVDADTDFSEIKSQYRKLIAACHPDKVASMSDAIKKAAEKEAKKLNEAYEFFAAKHN